MDELEKVILDYVRRSTWRKATSASSASPPR